MYRYRYIQSYMYYTDDYTGRNVGLVDSSLLSCARKAASLEVDEVQYIFLKRVCQMLVELGSSQIARLWVCILLLNV